MEEKNSYIIERNIDFFSVLRKSWIFIILVTLIFSLASALYTSFFVSKTYSSTVKFYVVTDRSTAHYLNTELDAAKTLIDSYSVVIKNSDSFLRTVAEESGIDYKPQKIRSMISVSSMGGEAFYVKVTDNDPMIAYEIARTIEEIGPNEIIKFVEAGNVKVLNSATLPLSPESPSLLKNVIFAAFLGAVLVFGAALLRAMFDTRIYFEEDLQKFGLPMLGSVPTIDTDGTLKRKKRRKKS